MSRLSDVTAVLDDLDSRRAHLVSVRSRCGGGARWNGTGCVTDRVSGGVACGDDAVVFLAEDPLEDGEEEREAEQSPCDTSDGLELRKILGLAEGKHFIGRAHLAASASANDGSAQRAIVCISDLRFEESSSNEPENGGEDQSTGVMGPSEQGVEDREE